MSAMYKPDGYSTVSPYLIVERADATITFLWQAFGAEELRRFAGEPGDRKSTRLNSSHYS